MVTDPQHLVIDIDVITLAILHHNIIKYLLQKRRKQLYDYQIILEISPFMCPSSFYCLSRYIVIPLIPI